MHGDHVRNETGYALMLVRKPPQGLMRRAAFRASAWLTGTVGYACAHLVCLLFEEPVEAPPGAERCNPSYADVVETVRDAPPRLNRAGSSNESAYRTLTQSRTLPLSSPSAGRR